jgi:hypothetical protein
MGVMKNDSPVTLVFNFMACNLSCFIPDGACRPRLQVGG